MPFTSYIYQSLPDRRSAALHEEGVELGFFQRRTLWPLVSGAGGAVDKAWAELSAISCRKVFLMLRCYVLHGRVASAGD